LNFQFIAHIEKPLFIQHHSSLVNNTDFISYNIVSPYYFSKKWILEMETSNYQIHPRNPRWSSVTGEDWDAPRISHTCGNSLKNSPKKKGGRV
jgi:hypothetical protein